MTIKQAAKQIDQIADQLPRAVAQAEKENLELVWERMIYHSSGSNKPGKDGRVSPIMPINVRSGLFISSFEYSQKTKADGTESAVWNTAPYAPYLEKGTKRPKLGQKYEDAEFFMEPRPLLEKVIADVEQVIDTNRNNAIMQFFK